MYILVYIQILKDFLKKCLVKDPAKRYSVSQLQAHAWINQEEIQQPNNTKQSKTLKKVESTINNSNKITKDDSMEFQRFRKLNSKPRLSFTEDYSSAAITTNNPTKKKNFNKTIPQHL